MIQLYCVSIFLQQTQIRNILHICNGYAVEYKEIEITDQVNDIVVGYQIIIDGLKILLLPCNDFHKHKDFEIGLTADTQENWSEFIEELKRYTQIEYERFADDEGEYALIKDSTLHGPFFFIFDGQYANIEPLIHLQCTICTYDYMIYKEKIEPFFTEDMLKKIRIEKGVAFCIQEIIVKHNADDISFTF